MERRAHWEAVYEHRQPTEVSWYQRVPTRSLSLLEGLGLAPDAAILDVGGGDSTLVDALLERGFERLSVLDISAAALTRARARLGARAAEVTWIEGDVTAVPLRAAAFDVWHDRAVFHFLLAPEDRARYAAAAAAAVRPGGALVMATFAPDGPTRCSGLDVLRYDGPGLARELGPAFELVQALAEGHRTPAGVEQRFTWSVLRRR